MQKNHPCRATLGFTLIELLVSISLIGILTLLASEAFGPAFTFYQKNETANRLKDLRASIEQAYKSEELAISSGTAAQLTLAGGNLLPVTPSSSTNLCTGNSTTFAPIGRYLSSSASDMYRDGHGKSFCLFISDPLTTTLSGVTVTYYAIAAVSGGVDGTIDTTTALSSTGVLTLGKDDKGFLIDGKLMAKDKLLLTEQKLQRIADAYDTYFRIRYLSNVGRDVSINYFAATDSTGTASSRYDTGAPMPTTAASSVSMTTINAHIVLGLSLADVTDAYGQVFMIDNSSSNVRNPDNTSAGLTIPPYTARISTSLPGGSSLIRTVTGSY